MDNTSAIHCILMINILSEKCKISIVNKYLFPETHIFKKILDIQKLMKHVYYITKQVLIKTRFLLAIPAFKLTFVEQTMKRRFYVKLLIKKPPGGICH